MDSDHTCRGQATPSVASSSFLFRFWVHHTWAVRHDQWHSWPFIFFLLLVTIQLKLDSTRLPVFWTGLISGDLIASFEVSKNTGREGSSLEAVAQAGLTGERWLWEEGRAQSAPHLPAPLQGYSPALPCKCSAHLWQVSALRRLNDVKVRIKSSIYGWDIDFEGIPCPLKFFLNQILFLFKLPFERRRPARLEGLNFWQVCTIIFQHSWTLL